MQYLRNLILVAALMVGLVACDIEGLSPQILNFTANPSTVDAGETSTLSWVIFGGPDDLEVTLTPGDISLSKTGSLTVNPTETTTYTLSVGDTSTETTVTVTNENPDACINPVNIPDAGLEAAIRNDLDLGDQVQIDCDILASLVTLNTAMIDEPEIGESVEFYRIDTLEGLQFARNLEELDLTFSGAKDISQVRHLKKLTRFSANFADITDISALANLVELESVALAFNMVEDITPLSGLTKLKTLGLAFNPFGGDITPILELTNLELLGLSGVGIEDLRPIGVFTELKRLNVPDNNISDISGLEHLTKLETLLLSRNNVSDLSPLKNLTNLNSLWLEENAISDIQPLVDNPGIGAGDRIDLEDNPLSDAALHDVEELRSRGVNVSN